jgi:hypothetical protein
MPGPVLDDVYHEEVDDLVRLAQSRPLFEFMMIYDLSDLPLPGAPRIYELHLVPSSLSSLSSAFAQHGITKIHLPCRSLAPMYLISVHVKPQPKTQNVGLLERLQSREMVLQFWRSYIMLVTP